MLGDTVTSEMHYFMEFQPDTQHELELFTIRAPNEKCKQSHTLALPVVVTNFSSFDFSQFHRPHVRSHLCSQLFDCVAATCVTLFLYSPSHVITF